MSIRSQSSIRLKVGHDVIDFTCALKHSLRQDPDILLIGELRDREDDRNRRCICVDTGHLVFSTLHTPDARQTITRITHQFTHEEEGLIFDQLSKNLQGVLCQRLMRTVRWARARAVASKSCSIRRLWPN